MAVASMRELLEAGVHFGHQTRRWNPKMRRFIFNERSGIYIIDLTQTSDRLDEAAQFVRNLAERNGTVLFVGTKKQAQDAIAEGKQKVSVRDFAKQGNGSAPAAPATEPAAEPTDPEPVETEVVALESPAGSDPAERGLTPGLEIPVEDNTEVPE